MALKSQSSGKAARAAELSAAASPSNVRTEGYNKNGELRDEDINSGGQPHPESCAWPLCIQRIASGTLAAGPR